jgi:hypothetical protein
METGPLFEDMMAHDRSILELLRTGNLEVIKADRGWTPLLIAQGLRNGNFKPRVPTIVALSEIMLAQGVTPPPAPDRDSLPRKKGYGQR